MPEREGNNRELLLNTVDSLSAQCPGTSLKEGTGGRLPSHIKLGRGDPEGSGHSHSSVPGRLPIGPPEPSQINLPGLGDRRHLKETWLAHQFRKVNPRPSAETRIFGPYVGHETDVCVFTKQEGFKNKTYSGSNGIKNVLHSKRLTSGLRHDEFCKLNAERRQTPQSPATDISQRFCAEQTQREESLSSPCDTGPHVVEKKHRQERQILYKETGRGPETASLGDWGWEKQIAHWNTKEKDLLVASWRPSTLATYGPPIRRWLAWCRSNNKDLKAPSGWIRSILKSVGIAAPPGSIRSAVASRGWLEDRPIEEILQRGKLEEYADF
ncbi:unnamed protein product [Colias eurytheme]|nr:unnamed protein product [Colias eurytheme]